MTLIELILYIALVAMFMAALIQFSWNIIYGRVKSQVQLEVNQNMRLAAMRISQEIKEAQTINSLSANSLSLNFKDSTRNPTVIDVNGGRLRLGVGSSGACPAASPCPLTSNLVNVDNLTFTNLSQGNSKHIQFTITLSHLNESGRQEWDKTLEFVSSAELRQPQ